MVIDVVNLLKMLNKWKDEELADVGHYREAGDNDEAEARENRAVAYSRVIDYLNRKMTK